MADDVASLFVLRFVEESVQRTIVLIHNLSCVQAVTTQKKKLNELWAEKNNDKRVKLFFFLDL